MRILVIGWQALPYREIPPFLGDLVTRDGAGDPILPGGVVWFWIRALERMGHEVLFFDHLWPRVIDRRRLAKDPSLFHDCVTARELDGGIERRDRRMMNDALLSIWRDYRPEVVLAHQAERVSPEILDEMGRSSPTATWIGVNPFNTSKHEWMETLFHYRFVFTGIRSLIPIIEGRGVRAGFLSFAFDPEVHRPVGPVERERTVDLGLLGTHKFPRRRTMRRLARQRADLSIGIWGRAWPADPVLDPLMRGFAWGEDVARAVSSMGIHLNIPQVGAEGEVNMRVFETAGIGRPILTRRQRYLADHFEEEKEVFAYDSFDELTSRIDRILSDPEEARAVAGAARRRALESYSYEARLGWLLEEVFR